ncbi:MAG: AMP-binding protein, partial [Syntrophales bacterium]
MEYNIYASFEAMALKRGDSTAVIYLGTRYSYRELKNLAERFAAGLLGLGVTPGQKVMLYIPNTIQWVVAWLGIQRAGAIVVPIT